MKQRCLKPNHPGIDLKTIEDFGKVMAYHVSYKNAVYKMMNLSLASIGSKHQVILISHYFLN